ncbi:hypothetical protein [Aquibacillus sediminis]|uniref:hypothetical protein n=1 Tax=Aquibacillus sediminis TaxID=2574734 RepID=UPI0011083EA9|nr:hypothetical protein [Aquibacillus sediminis]
MINYGKEIFQDNMTQLITIIVSLGLAIVAKKLSGEIANMSIINFIKDGYSYIKDNEHLSLVHDVFVPLSMYIVSCACLLWMGVTNLVTRKEQADSRANFLKLVLGCFQLCLFTIFLFIEGKLFFYFMLLVFTVILLIGAMNVAASNHDKRNRYN